MSRTSFTNDINVTGNTTGGIGNIATLKLASTSFSEKKFVAIYIYIYIFFFSKPDKDLNRYCIETTNTFRLHEM